MNFYYTIIIQWSNQGQCYLVHLPEFPSQQFHTYGDTYQEALQNAEQVLELLVEEYQKQGITLPTPIPELQVSQLMNCSACLELLGMHHESIMNNNEQSPLKN
jgi:antitoxin HicB